MQLTSDSANDRGLSLIELIVAILVATIVLAGVATVLINSWFTQNDVLSTSEATNRGQLISASIERAVRNAEWFEPNFAGTELLVHTTFNDPALNDPRTCQAFSLGSGKAKMKNAPKDLDSVDWGTWIDDSAQAWDVEVAQSGSTPIFVQNGRTLVYTFQLDTESAPVRFQGEVTMRAPSMTAQSPC
jgi:prepilin-type N-terminal cleavage/methylation domain-containing protein